MQLFLDREHGPKVVGAPIIDMIRNAGENLFICSPYLSQLTEPSLISMLSNVKQVRLIVDVHSGACDPFLVSQLMKAPNVSIRFLNNVHAKVFISAGGFIIGSANLTNPGLIAGNIEAITMSNDAALMRQAVEWAEAIWKISTPIESISQLHWDRIIARWKVKASRERDQAPHFSELLFADRLHDHVFTFATTINDHVSKKELRLHTTQHQIILPTRFDYWTWEHRPRLSRSYKTLNFPKIITISIKSDNDDHVSKFTRVQPQVSKYFDLIAYGKGTKRRYIEIHEKLAEPGIDYTDKQKNQAFVRLLNIGLAKNHSAIAAFEDEDDFGQDDIVTSENLLNIFLKGVSPSKI